MSAGEVAWSFPAIGFDPLPGDAGVAAARAGDARSLGLGMREVAQHVGRLARPGGWTGAAADAFAGRLGGLAADLDRHGEVLVRCADLVAGYHERFVAAAGRARQLELEVAALRRDVAAGPAYAVLPEGFEAVDVTVGGVAQDRLDDLLGQARRFARDFDDSVADVAGGIRALAADAPSSSLFGSLAGWAKLALASTTLGALYDRVIGTGSLSVAERAVAVAGWTGRQSDAEWAALVEANPRFVADTPGVPYERRYEANRLLIGQALDQTRLDLAAAKRRGDADEVKRLRRRVRTLEGLLEPPDRQFLLFDNRGDGRVAEVMGDLDTAANVAVNIPGMANNLDNYRRLRENSKLLHEQAAKRGRKGEGTATIAWLGYDTPGVSGVLLDGEAKVGATALQGFVDGLTLRDEVTTTVVAHSYGSLVTGLALRSGLRVDNVAVIGSPGIGAGHVDDLNLPEGTDLWAGRAPFDPVTHSEWHGADPTDPRFGGRRFETGQGTDEVFPTGHSSYFEPDSDSLANLAHIVTNQEHRVSEVAPSLVDKTNMAIDGAQDAVGRGGQWASSGVDHAQSAVGTGAGAAGDAVDWTQRRFDNAMDHVPGGGFVSDGINTPVDVAQAGAGAALDAGQAVVDTGQAAADALADELADTVDVAQEAVDKVGDVAEDAWEGAKRIGKKVWPW